MDKIKVLNDLKALEMKRQHIESINSELGNPFQGTTTISINGKNIKVGISDLRKFLENEIVKTKIEYDDTLKKLIDDDGCFEI